MPPIWSYELLNGIGKGIARGRIGRQKGFQLWHEINALPIHPTEIPIDNKLLELMLVHHLSVYDASYLSLAIKRHLPIATGDVKLQEATRNVGLEVIHP